MASPGGLTADKERQLIKLLKSGTPYTTSRLGQIFNVSRNAIAGKIFRLRKAGILPPVGKPMTEEGRKITYGNRVRKMKKTFIAPPPQPMPKPAKNDLKPLGPKRDFPPSGTCRWFYGDPTDDWYCCGRKTELGKSWCPDHLNLVYQATRGPNRIGGFKF